jgi:hypothetical protein
MNILAYILAALMALNGVYMFIQPAEWYAAVPGVPDTGPLNLHFVRDIGIAYFTAGAALLWSVLGAGWRASALGAAFIGLHSLLHVGETIAGHHHDVIVNELVAVHLPAVLAIVIATFQYKARA